MRFVDIVFIVGILLLIIGSYSAFSLLRLSINKTKEELKDINVANLWVLFLLCCPVGLILIYFWFWNKEEVIFLLAFYWDHSFNEVCNELEKQK